mmetsp:Transcript_30067/g.68047  ORF Transcript_30067/g.68047 Transcript_30067/m.68047 type:complete len:84 (+) Transcript_30067:852-1103(+)
MAGKFDEDCEEFNAESLKFGQSDPHFASFERADANLHAEAKRPSKGFGKEVFERLVRMKENLAQLPDNIIRSLEIETVKAGCC